MHMQTVAPVHVVGHVLAPKCGLSGSARSDTTGAILFSILREHTLSVGHGGSVQLVQRAPNPDGVAVCVLTERSLHGAVRHRDRLTRFARETRHF